MAAGLLFDLSLVDQHHRDVLPDRIDPLALDALQSALVRLKLHGRLAEWAHQDL